MKSWSSIIWTCGVVALLAAPGVLSAQDQGSNVGGGDIGGGDVGGDIGTGGGTGGGGGGTGGGPDNSLEFTELGLRDAFGANDQFQDTRRITGDTAGAGGGGGGGGFNPFGNAGGLLGQLFGGQQVQNTGRRVLRAPLRADFEVIRPSTEQVATQLEGRFVNIRPLRGVGDIRVQMVDRTAILTGTVGTAKQKDIAERITRLEPGISTVQNQLVVLETEASVPN